MNKVAHGSADELSEYFPPGTNDEPVFDEAQYLAANPDVADLVSRGKIPSGIHHYLAFGKAEGRSFASENSPSDPQDGVDAKPDAAAPVSDPCSIDTIICSKSGSIFFAGWAAETSAKIRQVRIGFNNNIHANVPVRLLARYRRPDVEKALSMEAYPFGFCTLTSISRQLLGAPFHPGNPVVTLQFENGAIHRTEVNTRTVEDHRLLEIVLGFVANADFCGNRQVETMFFLDGHLGNELIRQSREISARFVQSASFMRFGSRLYHKPKATIVVCLYGRPEYLFIQNSSFFAGAPPDEFEFVYVCNSPDDLEALSKSALVAHRVYGISQTIVLLAGNAGFGGANNAAAKFAKSDRIIFLNPDVLPISADWFHLHEAIFDAHPADRTRLFGARLFYSDGSLMHAGMYFEMDCGISLGEHKVRKRPMVRVEHYGKGAPPFASQLAGSRQVPAVSGAFVSIDRNVFEKLNGFSDEFVYGHYEDADLCLRARRDGIQSWVHDVPMWHLEGKGSTRLPHHEGASLLNRWQFTRRWRPVLVDGLLGPAPTALIIRADTERESSPEPQELETSVSAHTSSPPEVPETDPRNKRRT